MSLVNMSVLSGLQFPLTALATSAFTGGQERALTGSEEIGAAFVGGVPRPSGKSRTSKRTSPDADDASRGRRGGSRPRRGVPRG